MELGQGVGGSTSPEVRLQNWAKVGCVGHDRCQSLECIALLCRDLAWLVCTE